MLASALPLSRSLTVAGSDLERPARHTAIPRSTSSFIAHLLAEKHDAPQFRMRRRADPVRAVAAYGNRPGMGSGAALFVDYAA